MTKGVEDDGFEVIITGVGVKISKTVSAAVASEIIALTMGTARPDFAAARQSELPAQDKAVKVKHLGARVSVREFLDGAEAKRYSEKITAIGLFLMEHENASDFSKDDIQSRFRSAGEAPPQNFHRDFNGAVVNGWLAEDTKKPNAYYVTQKGRIAINDKFSAEVRKAVKPVRRKGKKKTAKV